MAITTTRPYLSDYLSRLSCGKIRQDKHVINKFIFLALGINVEGQKKLMGMCVAQSEGGKFCLSVLTELQHSGLKILIDCVD